ncbi:hypothetical protein EYC80_002353 [Monilinia laxa]|uniref:Uncharacterized protein n=1 Tax=Monilinia laxa TaxID=61186 RepID=A0A5N6K3K6_MONLA|nr:hypothetical protein EYC80_002353 [Monilinia laxa]
MLHLRKSFYWDAMHILGVIGCSIVGERIIYCNGVPKEAQGWASLPQRKDIWWLIICCAAWEYDTTCVLVHGKCTNMAYGCIMLERDMRNVSQLEKRYIALLLLLPSLRVILDWWIQCPTVLSTPLPLYPHPSLGDSYITL